MEATPATNVDNIVDLDKPPRSPLRQEDRCAQVFSKTLGLPSRRSQSPLSSAKHLSIARKPYASHFWRYLWSSGQRYTSFDLSLYPHRSSKRSYPTDDDDDDHGNNNDRKERVRPALQSLFPGSATTRRLSSHLPTCHIAAARLFGHQIPFIVESANPSSPHSLSPALTTLTPQNTPSAQLLTGPADLTSEQTSDVGAAGPKSKTTKPAARRAEVGASSACQHPCRRLFGCCLDRTPLQTLSETCCRSLCLLRVIRAALAKPGNCTATTPSDCDRAATAFAQAVNFDLKLGPPSFDQSL